MVQVEGRSEGESRFSDSIMQPFDVFYSYFYVFYSDWKLDINMGLHRLYLNNSNLAVYP